MSLVTLLKGGRAWLSHPRSKQTIISRRLLSCLPEHFQECLTREVLQPLNISNPHYVVGVSGGCDSVALLHLLHGTGVRSLTVVHCDHQRRDEESDVDRVFVDALCQKLNVPCHIYYWENADSTQYFSQDTARQWRYQRLVSVAQNVSNPILLTAHHKDDSYETLLLKLIRGTHISNLQGMQVLSRTVEGLPIARPLLHFDKEQLIEFLKENYLTWREDSSNQSDKYLRNRVRNELLPLLADLAGGKDILERRLENLQAQSEEIRSDLLVRAEEYLAHHVQHGLFLLSGINPVDLVQREALYMWISSQGYFLSYEKLLQIVSQIETYPDNRQWTINIGDGVDIIRQGDSLKLRDSKTIMIDESPRVVPWNRAHPHGNSGLVILMRPEILQDCTFYQSVTGLQNPWFTPPWRRGRSPVRVTEFLRGQKVPLHERSQAPLVYLIEDGTTRAVAVYVKAKKEWIVDEEFDLTTNETDLVLISLQIDPSPADK